MQDRVVVKTLRDVRRLLGNIFFRFGPYLPAMFPTRRLIRREAAAMGEHDGQLGMTVEYTTKVEAGRADGSVERITDQVVQIIGLHPIGARNVVGMHENE